MIPTIAAIDSSVESTVVGFTVYGKPAQMGSKKAFVRGGRAIITDDNSAKRKQWANAVASAAAAVMGGRSVISSPVYLQATFYFQRPKSHFGSGKNADVLKTSAPMFHSQTPDLDKLIRCLGDAMAGIVYRDDSQIVSVLATRRWTTEQERCEVELTEK